MDNPKFGQPKGPVSKIPVRQIRPPSKLPVPISSKENQPKTYLAQSKSSNIKNAVTRSQPKPTSALLTSRAKQSLANQKARPVTNTVKRNKSHLKQAEPKSKTVESVSSKSQQNTHKAESAQNAGELVTSSHNPRLNNHGYSKGVCKSSANLGIQTKSSDFSVQHIKKPLDKGNLPENRRLTGAASRIQNVNLAIVKNTVVNRRLADISRKNHNQISTNFKATSDNVKLASVDSTRIQRNNNFGSRVRKQSSPPEKFKSQNKRDTQDELFPSVDTPKMFAMNLPEVNDKIDSSNNQIHDGFSNMQDAYEKENGENHFLQPNVDFVPDERYRNQILFGQGISPNIKPKKFKSSIIDRPSFFLKSKTALKHLERLEEAGRKECMLRMSGLKVRPSQPSTCDPIQAVLRALENVDLAAEDRRVSAMKKNNPSYRSQPRSPMFQDHVDPYKTALKRIEELQMKKAKSTRKVTFNLESSVSTIKTSQKNEKPDCKRALIFSKEEIQDDDVLEEEKTEPTFPNPEPKETTPELQLPPNSSYTADKLKRNLEIQDVFEEKTEPSIPNPEPKETTPELQLPPDSSYTADKLDRNLTQSHYWNMLLRVCNRICSPDKKQQQSSEGHETSYNSTKPDCKTFKRGLKTSESTETNSNRSTEPETRNSLYLQQPIQHKRVSALTLNRKCDPSMSSTNSKAPFTPILKPGARISESVGPCFRTLGNRFAEPAREDSRYSLYLPRRPVIEPVLEDTRYSLYLPRKPQLNLGEQDPRRSTLSKLCTPRPISFFPKPGNADSISPEFLCRRTSQIVAQAPISTPMVLRTMAANLEDSPSPSRLDEEDGQVCQRLDFDDDSEEKPVRASISTPFKFNKCPIPGIVTNQQMLDNMADEECQAFSSFTWLPGNGERNFWNPVAHILTHGDDMHFVPLKLT
ncbi:hypothetical protein JTE90_009000 [Oedothorax gibbosus]|uniref:Uncharacterized protein n=1 Tax=Oedothorax gibbosus TaxID=931172 RepID=A0AAV6VLC0_9ARAC|nr:hypothetical protein JTE90_009000 [Oedothorax gibbosus]